MSPRTKFSASQSGAVAVQIAIVLTILIGFAALGAEVGYLYFKQRQMQAAADAAAFGGAVALSTHHPSDFAAEARAIAAGAGYVDGAGGDTVTVNNPPTSGSYAGNNNAVEVLITEPQTMSLINVFRSGDITPGVRAVAVAGASGGLYCIFALDGSASSALVVQNNAIVANPNCGVAVNSTSASALIVNNNGAIRGPVSVRGQWSLANNAVLSGKPQTQNAPAVTDPYAGVQILTPPACTAQSGTVNGTKTLSPGHFCGGLTLNNNSTATLGPGAYYIDTRFILSNGATLNATGGVTLIVNGNYAINVSNSATLNVTAPISGTYVGLALISSPTATPTIQQTFGNLVVLNIVGAVYFPNQIVNFNNNSFTATTRCTQIIGRIVNVSNNVYLNNDCAGTGVSPLGGASSKLVE